MSAVDRSYIVYLLDNTDNARTYVGCTNNPARRLRQHRQEIKGGAKATRGVFSWRYVLRVGGFKTKSDALSFEWHCKRRKGATGKTPVARRCSVMCSVLGRPRWADVRVIYKSPDFKEADFKEAVSSCPGSSTSAAASMSSNSGGIPGSSSTVMTFSP